MRKTLRIALLIRCYIFSEKQASNGASPHIQMSSKFPSVI